MLSYWLTAVIVLLFLYRQNNPGYTIKTYMHRAEDITTELKQISSPERARSYQRYFKTGPGEYGEGDVFIGVAMPQQRSIAKKYTDLSTGEIKKLLDSKIHEERMVGLLILTYQYPIADAEAQRNIFNFYIDNTSRINSWDLVDVTAPKIVGAYLVDKDRSILLKLAQSKLLWDRRIAILSTVAFINRGEAEWTFKISELLLEDDQDLIHKAVGWMLREVGKKCGEEVEVGFLNKHYKRMPRTMLRYAIEKFSPTERDRFLKSN
jgi:3-methyladenine DNA glycosylase AlkD